MASPLIALLKAPDHDALERLLAETVRFRSPVADYEGRADVAHLLSLIATIVEDIQPTRELGKSTVKVTVFSGVVDASIVQGVLEECYDENGLLIDAMLLLRPFATLRVAISAMAAALEAAAPAQRRLTLAEIGGPVRGSTPVAASGIRE